jgi:hypothetical protein
MKTIKTHIDNFFIWFGNKPGQEKITFGRGEAGVHYTIIFKGNKRVVDIHKTIELSESKKEYEQILEMSWFTFMRFIILFHKSTLCLLRKFWFTNRINLGKLGHHNLVLFPLTLDDRKSELFIENKQKKKIGFRNEISVTSFREMFFYLAEVPYSKQKSFWVYSTKKGILKQQGIIFQHEGDLRTRSFYFITKKNLDVIASTSSNSCNYIMNSLKYTLL